MKKKICALTLLCTLALSAMTVIPSVSMAKGLKKASEGQLTYGKDVCNICNFENKDEAGTPAFQNYFGKWSFNDDLNYVRNGKGSLKVSPQGYGLGTEVYYGAPTMRIYPGQYGEELKDFTDVEYIAFDVYNAGNEDETLKFAFVGKVADGKIYQQSDFRKYLLKTGRWTRCFYPVPYEALSLTFDMKEITELVFKFTPKYYKDELPVLYIDNITVKKTDKIREPLSMYFDENEICDFEKEYQRYSLQGSDVYTPKLEITSEAKYVTSGKNALKVTMPHGTIKDKSWPSFKFSDSLVKKANLGQYDAKSYSLKFDCYNTQDTAMKFFIKFVTENPKRPDANITTILFVAKPGFNTCTISLETVNELGHYKNEKTTMLEDLSQMRVDWGEFPGEDRVFYFDNFRVEKNV